jgi:hypothetical protein
MGARRRDHGGFASLVKPRASTDETNRSIRRERFVHMAQGEHATRVATHRLTAAGGVARGVLFSWPCPAES